MFEKNQNNQKNQTKSNGRGGSRPNAGRKKSAATVKTREIADKVIAQTEEGQTPLEVMMRVMTGFMAEAEQASNSEDPDEKKAAMKLWMMAADVAKDAAPYIHPRLSAIDHTSKGKEMGQMYGVLQAPAAMNEDDWEAENGG
jgi:hypothetical protein